MLTSEMNEESALHFEPRSRSLRSQSARSR